MSLYFVALMMPWNVTRLVSPLRNSSLYMNFGRVLVTVLELSGSNFFQTRL